jgi:CHAT domain-containing protein/tetratricopeptide (TPR) repeat protein
VPPAHFDHLRTLNLAALVHSEEDDPLAARDVLEHVLEVLEATRPKDDPGLQKVRTNLAVVRYFLGDIAGSRELCERVIATLEPDGDPRQLAAARGVFVGALLRDGEIERALHVGEEMMAEAEQLAPHDQLRQSAYQTFALALQAAGELERAEGILNELLHTYELTPPRTPTFPLEVHELLAAIEWERGQREAGLERLEYVLGELSTRLGPEDPWLAYVNTKRARHLADLGRRDELPSVLAELANTLMLHAHQLAARQSPRELDEAFGAPVLAGALDVLIELDEDDARVFRVVESLRGLGLQSARRVRAARGQADVAAGLDELRVAHAAVRTAYEAGEGVEGAVRARDATERELLARAREALGPGVWELEVDAAALPSEPGRAIVTLRRHRTRAGERFLAFVLGPSGLRRVDLGPALTLDGRIDDWREAVLAAADPELIRSTGLALAKGVLGPLELPLDELRHLVLCPDDSLHLVPFDALPLRDGVLGDRVRVELRTSLHELRAAVEAADRAATDRLVAFGGIDYGGVGSRKSEVAWERSAAGPFPALPATAEEVALVAALFRDRYGEDATVDLRLGRDATRSALLAAAEEAGLLHLSTHGYFSAPDDGPTDVALLREAGLGGVRLSPLSSTGLALAGANLGRDELGREQGRVTAEELAGLDLSQCRLVVLSACDTGLGRVRAGQGVASLQRALRMAGARTVVSSLWRVGDSAALELMRAFYTALWVDGLPPAEALWAAKQTLRDERRPVRDWAGWVLTGEAGS